MKKTLTLTTLSLLGGAVSVYSQGAVSFADGPDSGSKFGIQVFALQSGSSVPVTYGTFSGKETMGSSGNNYYAYNTSAGSASFLANSAVGAGYSVQLLIGTGSGLSLNSLSPVGPVITQWYTGNQISGLGGFWKGGGIVTTGSVGDQDTVAIAAWNNEGGTITSLQAALTANANSPGSVPLGFSNTGNLTLGGSPNPPANLPTTLQSFSMATQVPEPSTIALGVIGASTLLFRRRK